MKRPLVAIVGSVGVGRGLEPPILDAEKAQTACQELGAALAAAGWDIAVYSEEQDYIESDVVRGYLASGKAPAKSIHVHAPQGKGAFPAAEQHASAFEMYPDPARDWEVAFFRSVYNCDGVLLVGGGRSTLVAGVIAMARRIPVVSVATFGGAASKVWRRLEGQPGLGQPDLAEMAKPWTQDSAQRLVECLEKQRKEGLSAARATARQARDEARRATISLGVAATLLLLAVLGLVAAWQWSPDSGASIALLAAVPVLAGGSGALIKISLERGRDWMRAGVLGAAAGLITGLLYVASQLLGAPDVLDSEDPAAVGRLLFFVLPIGFVTGLTFDAVYPKLQGAEVSQAATLGKL